MARETKVGLLAGLAFIICFAIILANRGRQDLVSSQLAQMEQTHYGNTGRDGAEQRQPSVPPPSARSSQTQNEIEPSRTNHTVEHRQRPSRQDADAVDDQQLRTEGAPVGGVATTTPSPGEGQGTDAHQPMPTELPQEAADVRTMPLSAAESNAAARRETLEERLARLSSRRGSDGEPRVDPTGRFPRNPAFNEGQCTPELGGPALAPAAQSPVVPLARHTVVTGDTLWSVAAKYYQRGTGGLVNAIFEANRAVLSEPDRLRVGMVLTIPGKPGDQPATSPPPTVGGDQGLSLASQLKSGEPAPATSFRWYQVKKNDRYVSIAREQLGDGSRWREIFELNKSQFPDPDAIRDGVRIKLPVAVVA
ncbi:MAG: LysM peptidoglycan-binding domain-containing protein, partial [Planctomycetes bacterium]|nr:LysM peptidoglycan-binding domain-containing protein [Planctomycetota bacterium]